MLLLHSRALTILSLYVRRPSERNVWVLSVGSYSNATNRLCSPVHPRTRSACSRETRRGGVADGRRVGPRARQRRAAARRGPRTAGGTGRWPLDRSARVARVGRGVWGLGRTPDWRAAGPVGIPTLSTRISSPDLIPPSNVVAFIYTLSQLIRVNTVSPSRLRSHARVKPNDPARCETAVSRSLRLAQEGRHQS